MVPEVCKNHPCSYLKAYANHLLGVQVMATISLQCNSLSRYIQVLLQAENSRTGRACMGEVLTQVCCTSTQELAKYLYAIPSSQFEPVGLFLWRAFCQLKC